MQLPGPLRAAVGLFVSIAEETRHLPDRAIELPMLAVSSALQASLRAQQRYAGLAAKGDEVLNRRAPTEEPPGWATFDDPLPVEQLRRTAMQQPTSPNPLAGQLLDELFAAEDAAGSVPPPASEQSVEPVPEKAPVKKAAKKVVAKTASKKAAPAKRAIRSTAAATGGADSGKRVSKPRHTPPSAFDNVGD